MGRSGAFTLGVGPLVVEVVGVESAIPNLEIGGEDSDKKRKKKRRRRREEEVGVQFIVGKEEKVEHNQEATTAL